jgi:hypothetical protein
MVFKGRIREKGGVRTFRETHVRTPLFMIVFFLGFDLTNSYFQTLHPTDR